MAPGNLSNFIFQLSLTPHSCHPNLGIPLHPLTGGKCPLPRTFLLLHLANPNPSPSVNSTWKHFLAPSAELYRLRPSGFIALSSHHVGKSCMWLWIYVSPTTPKCDLHEQSSRYMCLWALGDHHSALPIVVSPCAVSQWNVWVASFHG